MNLAFFYRNVLGRIFFFFFSFFFFFLYQTIIGHFQFNFVNISNMQRSCCVPSFHSKCKASYRHIIDYLLLKKRHQVLPLFSLFDCADRNLKETSHSKQEILVPLLNVITTKIFNSRLINSISVLLHTSECIYLFIEAL